MNKVQRGRCAWDRPGVCGLWVCEKENRTATFRVALASLTESEANLEIWLKGGRQNGIFTLHGISYRIRRFIWVVWLFTSFHASFVLRPFLVAALSWPLSPVASEKNVKFVNSSVKRGK
jgi:hypothetical protein